MGGTGPVGKPGSTRQRAGKTSTNAVLRSQNAIDGGEVQKGPNLPPHPAGAWHAMTRKWWKDTWASPMAPEYDESDKHGLFILALLWDDFWAAEHPRDRQAASAEIRLQSLRFGLSPMDRRRLQWEIEKTEEAQARGKRRKNAGEAPVPAGTAEATPDDPRTVLRSV